MKSQLESTPHARIPADIDTPDKLIYGLTARQAAILAVTALTCYGMWRALRHLLPTVVTFAVFIPIIAVAVVVALGRRDGLSMDSWLRSALLFHRAPRRAVPAPEGAIAAPRWAPDLPAGAAGPTPTVLRLPAKTISEDGVIELGPNQAATMVATTTVNIGLRTGDEQWALLGGYGRWLNSLTGPVQIVVSAQRADLTGYATRVSESAAGLTNTALADAADDYANFLLDLAARRDPLWRTVTIVTTANSPRGAENEAIRRGEQAASALGALGVDSRVLDGNAVIAVLTSAVDPYQFADSSWGRATPQTAITAPEGSMP